MQADSFIKLLTFLSLSQAQDVINSTLMTPCILGQHTAGPASTEGATPGELEQRANSRESLETYSHILIDMADIMQEMVRYMNQYGRLLHRDPPLRGGDLAHCQNLVDRMGAMFHEVSHAFHMLSDYSITLDSAVPRRLWMAHVTGAHLVLSPHQEGGGTPVNPARMQEQLNRIRTQMQSQAGTQTATNTTADSSTSTDQSTTSAAAAAAGTSTQGSSGTTTATGTQSAIPTNAGSTQTFASVSGGNNGQPFAISFDIPYGGTGNPHAQIQQLLTSRLGQATGQGAAGQGAGQAAGANNTPPVPRPSLSCNSRHRIFGPLRCPVHNPNAAGQGPRPGPTRHAHGGRHSHSHGMRQGHAHGVRRTMGPRAQAAAQRPSQRQRQPASQQTPPPPQQPGNMANLLAGLTGGSEMSPEQLRNTMNLVMQMMAPSRQGQPISTHWPAIRALLVPNVAIPDQSHLGDLLHVVASHFSFQELMNALTNNAMFDIVYRPMRDHFNRSLFDSQVPEPQHRWNTVSQFISAERDLIIAFFDVRQNDTIDVDERATVVAIVREFVNTTFRELYNPSRGDIAEGFGVAFGQAMLRLIGVVMAYCTHVDQQDSRNQLINQMSGFIQGMIPFPSITRDELYDNYVVRVNPTEDTEEEEEFLDAEEEMETGERRREEMETGEWRREERRSAPLSGEMDTEEEEEGVSGEVEARGTRTEGDGDDLPDEVVTRPTPSSTVTPPAATPQQNGTDTRRDPPPPPPQVEVPAEWKRVLEEDATKLENTEYPPLSDGYLSSLPAKRRKTGGKVPKSDNPDEMLKELLTKSGAEEGLAQDPELAEMFKDKLRKDLKEKVKDDKDVNEEQFPSTSKLRSS